MYFEMNSIENAIYRDCIVSRQNLDTKPESCPCNSEQKGIKRFKLFEGIHENIFAGHVAHAFYVMHCLIYIDYFMVGERLRFLFTSCGESQTNERVFERTNHEVINVYYISTETLQRLDFFERI